MRRALRIAGVLAASLALTACWPDRPGVHAARAAPIVVTVRFMPTGAVLWNGVPVDDATLDRLLKQASEQNPKPQIHLTSDKQDSNAAVAHFLADAQRRGVTHIGFVGIETLNP
jgi:biopolymer transport protein ExbD